MRHRHPLIGSILVIALACDDQTPGQGAETDCRRAAAACAPGYTCEAVGDDQHDCVRDPSLIRTADAGRSDAAARLDAESPLQRDAEAFPDDVRGAGGGGAGGQPGAGDIGGGIAGSGGAGGHSAGGGSGQGGGSVASDVPSLDPDLGVEPVDAAASNDGPVEPDMAPPRGPFGPGRCDHDRRIVGNDPLDPNQDVPGARDILPGVFPDLIIHGNESDWYRVSLCAGGRLTVSVEHPFDGGDLDLQVFIGGARVIHSQGLCTGTEGGEFVNGNREVTADMGVYVYGGPGRDGGDNVYRFTLAIEGC